MEDWRSRSYGDGRMDMEVYGSRGLPPAGMHEMRCYSASHASSQQASHYPKPKEAKAKKGKSASGSSSKGAWSLSDPEIQRKKRVAGYKAYSVEGNIKGSLRKSFRWFKDRYSQVVYGWW